jgi:hypothetical protein
MYEMLQQTSAYKSNKRQWIGTHDAIYYNSDIGSEFGESYKTKDSVDKRPPAVHVTDIRVWGKSGQFGADLSSFLTPWYSFTVSPLAIRSLFATQAEQLHAPAVLFAGKKSIQLMG